MLFQPSNIYPSTFSGIGAGTVDVTQGINVSWQVNGDTPMTAYQIKIYQNDSGSTLMYDSGSVSVSPVFEPHDKNGNATYFTAIISAAALSTAGIVNGYQYGYKMLITQWWGVSDYVEQTSASVFITRSTPTLAINTITTPVASNSLTITANYSQAQGDPISTVEWVFALAGSESTPIRETGAISTQVLSFDADGLITGNTYSIMCKVVTSTGMEASTGFVQFPVSYSSSSLGINYQLAQLKNSSAVYLSWDDLGSNKLAYPYTDTTKTTNGITFTVNGEGDVVATGTASADAYFTIAQGTLSQLGITAGQKFIVTSGYSGAKIVVTETNSSNVVVSTITGNDPLQYIATSTTNTLKFSIVIPSGSVLSSGQQLKPMIALEDKIVAFNDASANIEPIQDLHGYANPWPAGGGKNLDPYDNLNSSSRLWGSNNSNQKSAFQSLPTGTYTMSCKFKVLTNPDSEANVQYGVLARYSDGGGGYVNIIPYQLTTAPATVGAVYEWHKSFTLTESLAEQSTLNVYFYCASGGASTVTANAYDIQIEKGVIANPTFSPYENICPISGRTGLNVYRTGVNVWDEQYYVSSNRIQSNYIPVLPNTTYNRVSQNNIIPFYYDADKNQLSTGTWGTGVFTTPADCYYLRFQVDPVYGVTYNHDISINYPSTDTDYHAYQGQTISVDLTTEAGTVYHGTVDVVTGELVVTHAIEDLGNITWKKDSNRAGVFYGAVTGRKNTSNVLACSEYTVRNLNVTTDVDMYVSGYGSYGGNYIFVRDTRFASNTAAEYKVGAAGIKVVYELATPLTYQLTPTQVAVLTGTNNVWSTGDSVSVTYTKDTGSQATLSGAIVTFSDSNAVLIPTPQYIPGITGISIYRYLQGESALQHVYDLATGATSILDYYAPSQMQVSYLIVAHSGIGDLFLQTTKFTPTFWFFSILLCDTDSNGDYHVSKEYIFKYGVETGAVSNNNDPTIQKNFTPYPNRQPISTLYKTGKISGYIGKTNKLNQYSDTISLQNAIYDISVSPLEKFLKTRKGDVIKVDTASSIQMKTEDNTTQQALKATIDWAEVGDASKVSIVSVPADSFWPM